MQNSHLAYTRASFCLSWRRPGTVLGPSSGRLGPSWGHSCSSWVLLGPLWAVLGPLGERTDDGIADLAKFALRLHESTILGSSRGSNWDHFGAIFGHLGAISCISTILESSWVYLAPLECYECHVIPSPCHVMSRHAVTLLCHVALRPCHVMSCHGRGRAMSCHAVAVPCHVISCRGRAISGAFVERKGYSHVLPTVLVRACALHLLVRPLFPRGGHEQGSGASPCLVMLAFAC